MLVIVSPVYNRTAKTPAEHPRPPGMFELQVEVVAARVPIAPVRDARLYSTNRLSGTVGAGVGTVGAAVGGGGEEVGVVGTFVGAAVGMVGRGVGAAVGEVGLFVGGVGAAVGAGVTHPHRMYMDESQKASVAVSHDALFTLPVLSE